MIYIVFSDVHSNLEALQAFVELTRSIKHDKKVFLGDAVGYGADPNACVDWIRENADIILAGNHDYAVVGKTDFSYFNSYAYQACLWTRQELTEENKRFLSSLPVVKEEGGIFWAHSSPCDPEKWYYVSSLQAGIENFVYFRTPVCFIGHSHVHRIFERDPKGNVGDYRQMFTGKLEPDCRYIINAGSIGQPRDGNPDPAFVVYNSETLALELIRFKYDRAEAQRKILMNGLPGILAERLSYGR